MSSSPAPTVCFATLAFGAEYRFHAQRLALDFEACAPHFAFLVLTDRPQDFRSRPNLQVHRYRPEGVLRRYHDKRLLIEAALPHFRTCVVIDANSRILEPLPSILEFNEGISGFLVEPLIQHLRDERADDRAMKRRSFVSLDREQAALTHAAGRLGVAISDVKFIQESIYAVTGDPAQLRNFTKTWGRLGRYMDHHGMAWSEGYAIGLAAAATGLAMRQEPFLPLESFYKHRLHGALLERGQLPSPRAMLAHREMALIARHARFSSLPKAWQRRFARIAMGIRWLVFRLTSNRQLRADGLD